MGRIPRAIVSITVAATAVVACTSILGEAPAGTLASSDGGTGTSSGTSSGGTSSGTSSGGTSSGGTSSGGTSSGSGSSSGAEAGGKKNAGDPCTPADTCIASQCVDGYCCTSACTDVCSACNVTGKQGTCTPVSGPPHGGRACIGDATGACAGSCDGIQTTVCKYPTSACGASPTCTAGVGTAAGSCSGGTCSQPSQPCADALCSGSACATVSQVTTGSDFACALLSDGTVRCWGANAYGQLGVGDTKPRLVPTPVPGLTGATAIGSGDEHVCAVLAGGALKCWGANYAHQLGLGDSNAATDNGAHSSPTPVCATGTGSTCTALTGVTKVTGGSDFTCAIVGSGVQCWGNDNAFGNLGIGPATGTIAANPPANSNPTSVCNPSPNPCTGKLGDFNGGIVEIAAGVGHVCAVDGVGDTWCWGNNGAGETGTVNPGNQNLFPQPMTTVNVGAQVAIKVSASGYGACALISDGNTANNVVRCWGYGSTGERGNSTSGSAAYGAAAVTVCSTVGCGTNLTGVTAITAGASSNSASTNCAVAGGAVYCWGDDTGGTAGTGTASSTPYTVATKTLLTNGAIGLGGESTGNICAVLNAGGTLRCWGLNQSGQLGDGATTVTDAGAPIPVPTPTAQKW